MIDIRKHRTREFIEQRVRKVVRVPELGECWEWTRARTSRGYGHFRVKGRNFVRYIKAHRAAYELFAGKSPGDLDVLHKCDNTCCCNPEHLFVGTHAENMADMRRKGRAVGHPNERNPNAKLSQDEVDHIRSVPKRYGVNKALSLLYGVSTTHIWHIRSGKSWPANAA